MTEEERALWDSLGLSRLLGADGVLQRLEVNTHALRHLLEEHGRQPHEATFGEELGEAMRRQHRENPYADPHPCLGDIRRALAEELAESFRRGWTLVYDVQGKHWLKLVPVLRSGAMVPLSVEGDRLRFLSHYFRPSALRDSQERRQEAAAQYLVTQHCPQDAGTGRWSYPPPWHAKEFAHKKRGVENRYNIRFVSLRFFGFPSRDSGSLWTGPDVRP